MSDESAWEAMREALMGLRVSDLRRMARDEHITLGYAAGSKAGMVDEIVSQRRYRALHPEEVTW